MGKAVMLIAGEDVKRVCGADQLSAGIEVGIEAAVHAVNELFDEHQGTGWGVLQVDASNAFNSLNRKVALWHARHLWPRGCRYLFNTYKAWATLVVSGSSSAVLYSREGTTQGDPLSMAFYALGVLPLIVQLKDLDKWIQIWYADDANNCGKLPLLREWFDMLVTKGPDFGYFPEPSKSILVVAECDIPEAERLFSDIGIQICTSSRILGGHVGSSTGRKEYIQQKVLSWVHHVDCLAEAAGSQPQDAYAALTKSLSFEWTFVQRVVQECGDLFEPVEEIICDKFLPQLLGSEFTPEDHAVFALPVKFAGLGIPNPTTTAKNAFRTSKRAASHLTDAISGQGEMDHINHGQVVMEARTEHRGSRRQEHVANLNSTLAKFADDKQRIVRRAADHPIGAWLSVLPCAKQNAVLSPREFRDVFVCAINCPSNTCTTDAMVVEHISHSITD